MNDVQRLVEHLLTKEFSIDSVRSIVEELKIDRDELMKILNDQRFADFFSTFTSIEKFIRKNR